MKKKDYDDMDGRMYLCRWSMEDKAYEVYICAAYQGQLIHLRATTPLPHELFRTQDLTAAYEVLGFCDNSCNRHKAHHISLTSSAESLLKNWVCARKRVNTVREAKTIISLRVKQLKQLESSDAFIRLWGYLNKAGAKNLAHLPRDCPDIDAMAELTAEEFNHWLQVFENIVFRAISFTPLAAKLVKSKRNRNAQFLWVTLLRPLTDFVTANRLGEMDVTDPPNLECHDIGFGWIANGEHLESKLPIPEEQPSCISFSFYKFGRASIEVYCAACRAEGFLDLEGSWTEAISFLFQYLHHVAIKLSANPAVIQTLIAYQEKLKTK